MAKNYNGMQLNTSATIVEKAGAAITDARCLIVKYSSGNVVAATSGSDIPLGITLPEAGANDVTGALSGQVASGDDLDVLIRGIGFVIAGGTITKGAEVTATTGGKAAAASAGDYVLGIALDAASSGDYLRVLINKYQKNPAAN